MDSNSKERGMIFNSEMVRAILSGQKTQTRRVMKPQPVLEDAFVGGITKPTWIYKGTATPSGWIMHNMCPFGAVGDLIWVRETFGDCGVRLVYRADSDDGALCMVKRWTPANHMPRSASRILLEITNVRVERLNDISNEDAKAEGYPAELAADGGYYDPFLWLRNLWDGIYPEQSFKHNPWVWVIEFKRVQEQING
nr:hypothetical protein [Obesumbacterium proteus]